MVSLLFLKNKIKELDKAYYEDNEPLVSDAEYDELKKKLELLINEEKKYNLFSDKDLEIEVGFKPGARFKQIKHKIPMISLSNALNRDEFLEFFNKINRFLNSEEDIEFFVELKIDGMSFSAIYKYGILEYIVTRGDGEIGEDITQNIDIIQDLPREINTKNIESFEIRGEVYMDKNDFLLLNETTPFANPRNATAGTLRNLNKETIKNRRLKYFVYSCGVSSDIFKNQEEALQFAEKELNFKVNEYRLKTKNVKEIEKFHKKISDIRYNLDYDIDGIVLKINSFELQNRLGRTNHSPRWALAYKFDSQSCKTKIENVLHQVGRTGILTPVAVLVPVNVGGVLINKATLHNYDEIKKKDLRISDIINIIRAGDVIPYVVDRLERSEDITFYKSIEFPKKCPSCGGMIFEDFSKSVMMIKCLNKKNCKEQIIQKIKHFISRDALDIKGLGLKNISKMYDIGILKNISDIWNLKNKKIEICNIEGLGEKSFELLKNSIDNVNKVKFSKFLYALGIEGLGEVAALKLSEYFRNIDSLLYSKNLEEDLISIQGIGEGIRNEILNFINSEDLKLEINKIRNFIEIISDQINKKNGQKIIFTGTFSISRAEIKEQAVKAGFTILSSVSKNLDLVVCGEDSGSKLKQAKELGLKILTEEEWKILLSAI